MARLTFAVLSICWVSVSGFAAPTWKNKLCPDSEFYYDHETNLCKPCIVLCENALFMSTVERCQTLCSPTYARLTDKQLQPELSALSLAASQDDSPTGSSPATLTLIAGIVGGAIIVGFLLILGAYMCKREHPPGDQAGGGQQQAARNNATEQGSNFNRYEYSPAGVREEVGEGAQGQRPPQPNRSMLNRCDPRAWFAQEPVEEEPAPRRQGAQEAALLGGGHGPGVPQLNTVAAPPIYKPSGSMRSTATRI